MRAVVAALVIAATLIAVPGDGQSAAGLIRIFAVTTSARHVDVGGEGRSTGDMTLRGARLFGRDGTLLGNMALVCTFLGGVLPGATSQCQATYQLPLGKIQVSGTRQRADYMVLAIVGGTGTYSRATGVLVVTTVGMNPRRERLLFSLES